MTNLTTEELAQYKSHCEAAKACDRQTIIAGTNDVMRMVAEIETAQKTIINGIAAMEGAQVLAEIYFDQQKRDPYNNNNYCRMMDWLDAARKI